MSNFHHQFIDPAGVLATYTWEINPAPDGESQFGKQRTVQRTAPTKGHGLIRQQQDDGMLVVHYKGTALTKNQHLQFIAWWKLCENQTVYFVDGLTGDKYEVLITSYMPTRKGVARNPRDLTNAPTWVYDFDIEMDVVTIISGSWLGVNP